MVNGFNTVNISSVNESGSTLEGQPKTDSFFYLGRDYVLEKRHVLYETELISFGAGLLYCYIVIGLYLRST